MSCHIGASQGDVFVSVMVVLDDSFIRLTILVFSRYLVANGEQQAKGQPALMQLQAVLGVTGVLVSAPPYCSACMSEL